MTRILVTAFISLALFSCSRDADADLLTAANKSNLEGNWRMVLVKENSSGLIYSKPGAITGDVDITFVTVNTDKGFINGKTPTNTLFADYTLYKLGAEGQITIPSVAATKVAETSWGLDFLYNITKSDAYSIEPDGKLRIHTENKTLYFERN
jgi:hypothetical protein